MLRLERPQADSQLVGVVFMLSSILTHPIQLLAQTVATGQQQLALPGIGGHGIQGVLQQQARLPYLLMLQGALLTQLGQFFVQTAAAQGQLLDLGLAGGELGLDLTLVASFILQATAKLLTRVFLHTLLLTHAL